MTKQEYLFNKLIGDPSKELGDIQEENSLLAVNQMEDADGNLIYGFDLHKIFSNSGDITNWFDVKEDGDEIFGCFYLASTLRVENSLVNEVDYFYSLVFKIPEDLRDRFQEFFDFYLSKQIGRRFENEDGTKTFTVQFPDGAAPDYGEKADDDGKDFIATLVLTIAETDPINTMNDITYYFGGTVDPSNNNNKILYTSVDIQRTTQTETQTLANQSSDVAYPRNQIYTMTFTIPYIKYNRFAIYVENYLNTGENDPFTLTQAITRTNITGSNLTTINNRMIITDVSVRATPNGAIVYNVSLDVAGV